MRRATAKRRGGSQCSASKTCTYLECDAPPKDEHRSHCYHRRMRRPWAGIFVFFVACGGTTGGGGSSSTAVADNGFSRACNTDDDCVTAYFGDTCGICSSSNAAIAKSAQASYQQAYNTARDHCPKNGAVGKCAQHYYVSTCEQKTCTFRDCNYDRPTDEHHCAADGGK